MINKMQTFPSIKAQMGDLTYFVTTMTFGDVAKWIKKPKKTKETDIDFKNWLQREIDNTRLGKIAKYLAEHDQRFFNAIVVGIFDGDPKWYPVSVSSNSNLKDIDLDERTKTSMGVLGLNGEEEAFPIDGQHRVEAIKEAIKLNKKLEEDELCVIFVAHKTNKAGRERTRRLFTTLNKYARPVSDGEIVALDEDDAFAIVTRKIMDEYRPLKGFVSFTKNANLLPNDSKGITTTVALYQLMQYLPLPKGSGSVSSLKVGPAEKNKEKIQNIYSEQCLFWDLVRKYVAEIKTVTASSPSKEMAGIYRKNGGHLLFRPVGQHAFAKAVRTMIIRGSSMENAVKSLSQTEFQLTAKPWVNVLWNPSTKNILTKYTKLAHNLFLYMVNEQATDSKYNILEEYKKITGNEKATLKGIKKAQN